MIYFIKWHEEKGYYFDFTKPRTQGPDETIRSIMRYRAKKRGLDPRNVDPQDALEILVELSSDYRTIERISRVHQGMTKTWTPIPCIVSELDRRFKKLTLAAWISAEINKMDRKWRQNEWKEEPQKGKNR
jgi:hypothetical protein